MKIIKRDGSEQEFDIQKIVNAISKANNASKSDKLTDDKITEIADYISYKCEKIGRAVSVEEIQDMVEDQIMAKGAFDLAKRYVKYRYTRAMARKANSTDDSILALLEYNNEEVKQENSNKNPAVNSVQRDYMAGEVSKDLTNRVLLAQDIVEAHKQGIIHFHDSDYFAQHMHNCDLVNLEDMLQNGTVISGTEIVKPHSFATACNVATQIVAQVASNQYGGQTISLAHISPFIDVSRQKIKKAVISEGKDVGIEYTDEQINKITESRLKKEIKAGVQTIQYQLVTLMTTNGQTPFVSVYMDINEVEDGPARDDLAMLIEEVLEQRIKGLPNEKGVWITPAFPKLLYVLDDNNVEPDSKYYYLTELAAKCTAKRMVPDYISAKIMREYKNGDVYACMGCRSFLTPDRFTDKGIGNIANAKNYKEGKHRYYGRFNQGVVTINLVDVALSSYRDEEKFWKIFDERLDLCYRALMARHNRLLGTRSDVAPILWQYGALARLEKGEKIDKLLFDGYSTISLGYAGLYECVKYMTGKSHTDDEAKPFALKVMQHMNDACAKWKATTNIDFSVYGTPIESTTYKFAQCLQKRFGKIEGITDRNYITNSYHVHVTEKIDAFTKLKFESEFQRLSPGGAISYVEVPDLQGNIPAVLKLITFIYNNIMYAELNTKSDYCQVCGYDGEIQIIEEDGKLIWECPNCKNRDQSKMNVARRTCGYIGSNFWNQGRTQEISQRQLALGIPDIDISK
ncbi:MAG: anaerobic ribonucleoside-triphosphate reductase [Ruminococcus sp.]|nr:anaerobic ribonucleoside-triphosphate reductase [Ruminococcus sp.]